MHAEFCLLLVTCFTLVSCLAYFSILKMEATCSSETSFYFQRTTRRCIPEDINLRNHRCENLKFHRILGILLQFYIPVARSLIASDDTRVEFLKSTAWPPNSPDMYPLDYHVWNELKQAVYKRQRELF
jgi:hypothetical protein